MAIRKYGRELKVEQKKFKHSGDMGDIIYSLPAIRALGGGTLYLDVNGGKDSKLIQPFVKPFDRDRLRFGVDEFNFLKPLLMKQSYIKDVQPWAGEEVDHDLDKFREVFVQGGFNLAECHLLACGINSGNHLTPWLQAMPVKVGKDISISRSLRRQSNHDFWDSNRNFLKENGLFLGLDLEYEVFCTVFEIKPKRQIISDALELASYMLGTKECWSNLTLTMCIAIGLGIAFRQEGYPKANGNIFAQYRENGVYV